MLSERVRRGKRSESGQTLILALAFIAFFGVVVVSVLGLASVSGLAHSDSENTARNNSLSEGGAAYGAADAGRPDLTMVCANGNSGTLTMQGGDQAKYTINACASQGGLASGPGPGLGCLLCILNLGGVASNPVVQLSCAQCTQASLVTTGGDDYINGSIGAGSIVAEQSAGPPVKDANIRVLAGGTWPGGCCTPSPTNFATAIADPLACGGPTPACPPASAAEPLVCTGSSSCTPNTLCHKVAGASWSNSAGCSYSPASTQATLGPGLWHNLAVSGSPSTAITLSDAGGSPGVYVFTGGFSVSGSAAVTGSDVVLYLACSNFTSRGQPCSGSGATISFGGNGSATFISAPTTGAYVGLAILSDPGLPDPGGSSCATSGTCMFSTAGNGASITGVIDTRQGGIVIAGNGGDSITSGRLITNSIRMNVSGRAGSGLALSGGLGNGVEATSCGVYDYNPVTGVSVGSGPYGAAFNSTGRAIVQSQCGSGDTGSGGAVTYGANTLTDTSKSWTANQWAGATVLAGSSTIGRVLSNSTNTLTLASNWSGVPPAGTSYSLTVSGIVYFNYVP